jgi:endonuclease YncB( thermonuclease family)
MKTAMFLATAILLAGNGVEAAQRIPATLIRVVDGDTIRADLDLGADVILKNQAVRVLGIDAPEIHGPERQRGLAAKKAGEQFLTRKKLEVELHGKDKYGRWLGDVFADGENLALWMLKNGHARPYQLRRK